MPEHGVDGVLITGVYGSGKSSVAAEITYLPEQRNQPYAFLDLDYLGWVGDHAMGYRMMLRNLAAVAPNYLDAGIGFFVVAYDRVPARIRGYGVDAHPRCWDA